MRLRYRGTRTRAFSVPCPSGARYPIEPTTTLIIDVSDEDGKWLLDTEATVWTQEPSEATEAHEEAAPKVRANRQRQQVNTDDGKS